MSGTFAQIVYAIGFYGLAIMAVIAAIIVISARNFIISAIWLVVTFVCVAGIYVLLKAPFLAMVQVLVYAGAIMVLFVILTMLTDVGRLEPGQRAQSLVRSSAVLVAAVFMLVLVTLSTNATMHGKLVWSYWEEVEPGTTEKIGELLFTKYLLPFEALTLLLVAAVVAALYLARREEKE